MSEVELIGPVVIRSPNWLGDSIMSMPAIRNVRKKFPQIKLTVATPDKLVDLWKLCPFIDEVISIPTPAKIFQVAQIYKAHRFATAILLPQSLRVALEARLAGIPQIIGYQGHFRSLLLHVAIPEPSLNWHRRHHQFYYHDLVKHLGVEENLEFPELDIPEANEVLNQIVICPGAEYGPAKRWPAEKYGILAQMLKELIDTNIVILGTPQDRPLGEIIRKYVPDAQNRCGETSLYEFMHEVARSRLVVCNDSGAMHVASLLGVPTVAIFGSTDPEHTKPLGSRVRIVHKHVPCSPCFLKECPIDFACMNQIEPDDIIQALQE
ncbi:MAG: lipopolysaccharide heptosyltransferase II [Methylacidiphilales bacterium]|nr:lipopolysaccharide heptosyltransferase II [Candidatus Methylacidiphilales bacterium]MDW8348754.1 lipopolysaccharide heptosyltransferase II [Verrucomicrobiae bacterium]